MIGKLTNEKLEKRLDQEHRLMWCNYSVKKASYFNTHLIG